MNNKQGGDAERDTVLLHVLMHLSATVKQTSDLV